MSYLSLIFANMSGRLVKLSERDMMTVDLLNYF